MGSADKALALPLRVENRGQARGDRDRPGRNHHVFFILYHAAGGNRLGVPGVHRLGSGGRHQLAHGSANGMLVGHAAVRGDDRVDINNAKIVVDRLDDKQGVGNAFRHGAVQTLAFAQCLLHAPALGDVPGDAHGVNDAAFGVSYRADDILVVTQAVHNGKRHFADNGMPRLENMFPLRVNTLHDGGGKSQFAPRFTNNVRLFQSQRGTGGGTGIQVAAHHIIHINVFRAGRQHGFA